MIRRKSAAGLAGVVALCSFLLASCSSVQAPKVILTGVEIEGMSVEGLELTLLADVRNPNDFGATIGELDYKVYVDNERLAAGLLTEDVEVPAGESVEVGIPFTLTWEGVGDTLEKALDGKRHDWKLKGSAKLRKGVLAKTFRFDESGSFTSPKAQDVEIDF